MTTFDRILPSIKEALSSFKEWPDLVPFLINRDLNGRVRIVLEEKWQEQAETANRLAQAVSERLGVHGFPADRSILYEPSLDEVKQGASCFEVDGFDGVTVVDRLAVETDWSKIAPVAPGAPRIVFFSIKGGVGRSTASAVAAWSLAQSGKRVMVLDLDLESPGLSSSLLPEDRRPAYGITDWLVEDLVDNGAAVFENMVARSELSHDGEIDVVPAHGKDPGEYVAKLGRVWMPKIDERGLRENWSMRLNRLLSELEKRWQPDVLLIDSRAGIDEVASACVTDLGAKEVLLFALDGEQTWSGYDILFRHWHRTGVMRDIRERLQFVGAMIPEVNAAEYLSGLCERAWAAFAENLYDEVPAGKTSDGYFSFDQGDESAPHYPWPIRWHRGFAALQSIHARFQRIDERDLMGIFGPLVEGIQTFVGEDGEHHGRGQTDS